MTSQSPMRTKPARRIRIGADPFSIHGVVLSHEGVFIGDLHKGVIKLEHQSYDKVWSFAGDNLAPVAVRDGVLLVASSDGLCGVDERTGTKLWGPQPLGPCVEWSQGVLALRPLALIDVREGSMVRAFNVSEEVLGNPFIAQNTLVGTSLKGDPVTAFHLVEKRVVWTRRLFAEVSTRAGRSEPSFIVWSGDETFLVGRTDVLVGCSLADGAILWESSVGVPYYSPNAIEGRAYVLTAGLTSPARFACVDTRNGRTLYDIPQPSLQIGDRPFRGTLAGEEIVFCTTRGLVIAFRREDGSTAWWHRSQERLAPAIAADGRVLVPTRGGYLLVFQAAHEGS
jgi:outer membrane protein assembly factor BamB